MSPPRRAVRLLLAAAPLLAGCAKPPAPPEGEPPPAQVVWDAPRHTNVEEWTELSGVTQPLPGHSGRVEARIDGRVAALLRAADGTPLQEGQEVAAGQEVGRLDDRIARLNRDKAVDALAAAGEDVAQAKTAKEQADVKLAGLQKLRDKDKTLVPDIDWKAAQAAVADAESKLRAAINKRLQAANDLTSLEEQLKLYALRAPLKGRLGRVQVTIGQPLAVGAAVADVIDVSDEIDVLCFVSARVAARVAARLADPAMPQVDALVGGIEEWTDHDAAGRVVFLADQAESDTGCFAMKVRFANKGPAPLRAGAVVRLRVLTANDNDHFAVKESALMDDQDPPGVIVVDDPKIEKNKEGDDEVVAGTARRLRAEVVLRGTFFNGKAVEHWASIKSPLTDPEGKKPVPDLADTLLFVTERGQGIQTGDKLKKLEAEGD
jgi:RND family efflux transporter MFP subunit